MEGETGCAMTWFSDVETWEDSDLNRCETLLSWVLCDKPSRIGIESNLIPTIFQNMLSETYPGTALDDISLVLDQRRMIKSDAEIDVMRQTGKISGAMMQAAEGSLSVRAPEYESALALINSITQKATDFLNTKGLDAFISSLIHNL